MSASFHEGLPDEAREQRLARLQSEAAQLGMRLVEINSTPEDNLRGLTTRDSLLEYAADTHTPPAIAFRGWRRLQELYTAKVQFETVGLITDVPYSTPLVFVHAAPIPVRHSEVSGSWLAWRQTLTQLDIHSLNLFMVQLDNAESRFGRNRYVDLLGKHNGPQMVKLLRGFTEQQLRAYNTDSKL